MINPCCIDPVFFKIERQFGEKILHTCDLMFGTLLYSYDRTQLSNTLHSFHLIRTAVHKEECDGYRNSVPVIAC